MQLWVTGANGALGTILRKKADFATGREVDIGDLDALQQYAKLHPGITQIVNCAAFSLVDAAEAQREEAFAANVLGPENLALVAEEIGAHLIHLSSDYVFSGQLHRPLSEDDETEPCSYYGWTKLEGEKRVLARSPKACVLRTSWIFGGEGKNFVAKLLALLQTKEELQLTDDHWGRPTYGPDLAEAILKLVGASGLYQFANSGPATKYAFGEAMREEAARLGMPLAVRRIIPVPGSAFLTPAKRPVYSAFNTAKFEAKFGKIRPWQGALQEYLKELQYAPC